MAAAKTKKTTKKKGATKTAKKKQADPPSGNNGMVELPGGVRGMPVSGQGGAKGAVSAVLPRTALKIIKGFNPRANLGDVQGLADNIKRDGLLHALVVRPTKGQKGSYDVVAGERRLRAVHLLGWKEVLCTIRPDLEGDDDRSQALAVAENSEDNRNNLNAIEIGRVVTRLSKKGWSIQKLAQECGLHPQKVRRCVSLMQAPKDVQVKVEKGELGMVAGLELSKLDAKTREKIKNALSENPSAPEIKRAAKKAARESGATEKAGSKSKRLTGQTRDAALRAWQGSRAKHSMISYLANLLHTSKKEDIGHVDYLEIRGALAYALWDRGELDGIHLPSYDPKDLTASKDKKVLAKFNAVVEAESGNYEPEDDDE